MVAVSEENDPDLDPDRIAEKIDRIMADATQIIRGRLEGFLA